METKKCSKCGRELPIECFRKCKTGKDGHRNDCKECERIYRHNHPEIYRRAHKKWREKNPIESRAHTLKGNYDREDEKYNRGKGDLTAQWIIENIFSKPCAHCGESDWRKIGCNRLDNSKPHTMDNVEPCCQKCNHNLALPYIGSIIGTPVDQIDPVTGEIIHEWESPGRASKELKIKDSHIRECNNGGYFDNRRDKWVNVTQYKGFLWRCHQKP